MDVEEEQIIGPCGHNITNGAYWSDDTRWCETCQQWFPQAECRLMGEREWAKEQEGNE